MCNLAFIWLIFKPLGLTDFGEKNILRVVKWQACT